ncbi:ribosome hibernation-promoting factor, HPF/YfiA family [Celerinatantimonas diazotrophica]|jgi:ribosome-associated inhibitor A|uniref:SSU ribosomal protein S30P /sigma 54 modulation protein n=1 Tax=Celerinatantimonas diazotrophica TaxID=412034 RepID=A0A4R1J9E9_9GAMM|nr:ribosome-associated translation inhibitor RaiA [Celerinatantimonas diazotrophica]TCK47233.1 SSU ribosomal protein S30P /sigma 54 modulation protein [Celerinatantimonas diazotrophica]CAG9296005.1 Ribosome-associated inhibitor A [Celerinatantimonas diazotrophica]
MIIDITSKSIDITPTIRERIENRFAKLEKPQIPLIKPQVIITREKQDYKVEAKIGVPNGQLFASEQHEDLYAAINGLGHKLERQLRRHHTKPITERVDSSLDVNQSASSNL